MVRSFLKQIPLARKVNGVVRGPMQDWSARLAREGYAWSARRMGLRELSHAETETALRARVASRRSGRTARRKGELHVFLAYGLTNWEAVLPKALAPFGRVTTFEWRSLGFDDSAKDWVSRRDEMNRAMLNAFEAANRLQPVDAVVGYLSGHNMAPEILLAMAAAGAVVYNFCLDDKVNFPGERLGGRYRSTAPIAHAVDLNLTSAPESILKYAVHGGLATFFPEAAHPELHCPRDLPFDFDVSFIGANYGWRPRFIRALERRGVHVECFGRGWPNGPVSDEDIARLYSRSRINLGFGAIGYSRTLVCLKGRDFEVPMSGGLYVTQHNPELSLVFDLGSEIITYHDDRDCAEQVLALLADPTRAEQVRRAGRARCLRDHTYEVRWQSAFDMAGLLLGD